MLCIHMVQLIRRERQLEVLQIETLQFQSFITSGRTLVRVISKWRLSLLKTIITLLLL